MGVGGNQMYMKQINMIMRQLRERMTLETLRHEIEASDLSDSQKTIARIRLRLCCAVHRRQPALVRRAATGPADHRGPARRVH